MALSLTASHTASSGPIAARRAKVGALVPCVLGCRFRNIMTLPGHIDYCFQVLCPSLYSNYGVVNHASIVIELPMLFIGKCAFNNFILWR